MLSIYICPLPAIYGYSIPVIYIYSLCHLCLHLGLYLQPHLQDTWVAVGYGSLGANCRNGECSEIARRHPRPWPHSGSLTPHWWLEGKHLIPTPVLTTLP